MITKENSLQFPEPSKLEKFNDLIEGLNEKCFSFKEDNNFIERYKKDNNNIKIKKISELNMDENIQENKDIINNINDDKDKCIACLLGCNVSKRGYSPIRYNPNNSNKEERRDDSADLLDEYSKKKGKTIDSNRIKDGNNKNNKNKRNFKTISKSGNSSLINSSSNSRRNSKSINLQKKNLKK